MAPTGTTLFQQAEQSYHAGRYDAALEGYQKVIKTILKKEKVDGLLQFPRGMSCPPEFPLELLANVWMNFNGFFRDNKGMNFTEASHPDAFKLLKSFCVSSGNEHPEFKTARQKFLLKTMQISASFTVGLLAWDRRDRATAAKRYKEALDLADTEPTIRSVTPGARHIEYRLQVDVQEMRDNYDMLKFNDAKNADMAGSAQAARKSNLNVPNVVIKDDVGPVQQQDIMVATDCCAMCGKREAKLPRCQRCRSVHYCGAECQKIHWKTHKPNCKAVE